MSIQDRALIRRSNAIKDSEIPKYIEKLKRFLCHEALAKAQANLDKDLMHHGRCYRYWAHQRRPWLFALRLYDRITNKGVHMPTEWPVPIREMAGDAMMISSLHHCMPDEVKAKYRQDLLTEQHNDFLVEICTAWHYYLEGFDIQWYSLRHEKCPEFRVRGGGLDFDVECRRFSWDVSNHVKAAAMADVCDTIYKVLLARNLWGEVKVEFSEEFRFDPDRMSQWRKTLTDALDASQTTVQLDGGVILTLGLKPSPSHKLTSAGLTELAREQQHPEVSFLVSKSDGKSGFDPVAFRCRSPRKTPDELRDYVYKTLKDKVATQLSPDRAGVAVVKFSAVRDPNVFAESEGMKHVITKLFSQRHLAAIVLRCEDIAKTDMGSILHSTPAIVFRNPETTFPCVAAVKHLS
ncbi:MAG: hypothetical protein FJ246_09885 [Nitrospira sp.]|nr:hypothetical protein [Nitrospira sp.]